MPAAGANPNQDSTSVIALTAEPRTPVGLTHRLKMQLGPAGWLATAYHDPYLAFAEVCLRERAQASRAAWGLQRIEKLALVIVDPPRWPVAVVNNLVSAARRYTPTASIWTYRDGQLQAIASPRVMPSTATDHAMTIMDEDDLEEASAPNSESGAEPKTQQTSAANTVRGLRLAGVDDNHAAPLPPVRGAEMPASNENGQSDDADSAAGGPAESRSSVVTRAEIELLLQRDSSAPAAAGGDSGSRGQPGLPS